MYSPYAHPVGVYAAVWGDVLHLQTLTMVEFPLALQNIIPKGQDKAHVFLHSLTTDFAKKPPSTGTAAALAQHGPCSRNQAWPQLAHLAALLLENVCTNITPSSSSPSQRDAAVVRQRQTELWLDPDTSSNNLACFHPL